MAAKLEEKYLRIYCPTHKVNFTVMEASRIVCAAEGEVLAKNFPYEGLWEYCCDCQTFWPSEIANGREADDHCQVCSRKIAHRYFCDRCRILSSQSNEAATGITYTLLPDGSPQPSCPGCSTTAQASLDTHDCYAVFASYVTARRRCPFCEEAVNHSDSKTMRESVNGIKESDSTHYGNGVESPNSVRFGRGYGDVAKWYSESLGERLGAWLQRLFSPKTVLWMKSHKRRMAFILSLSTIGSFLLSLFAFPPLYAILVWYGGKWTTDPPILKSIEYDKREVLAGENVLLKAILEHQPDAKPEFVWNPSAGWIEGSGPNVVLKTTGIKIQSMPLKVTVNLKITDGYGRGGSREVDIYIMSTTMLNRTPILRTIKCNCNTQEVRAGESVSLTAIVEDPDGDDLQFEWWSSTGQIEGQKESVTLNTSSINPQTNFAPVKVTLIIKDPSGNSVSDDIVINVVPKQPLKNAKDGLMPSPESLNNPPILVVLQPDRSIVEVGEPVKLEAIATDPNNDKLIYEWDSSKGNIEGGGPSITLTTVGIDPKHDSDRVIVTLTVRDGRGASASGKAIINVLAIPKLKRPVPSPTGQSSNTPF
jgi:hypothetical protein